MSVDADANEAGLALVRKGEVQHNVTDHRLLAEEIARRSSLRIVGEEGERQRLRTLDGEVDLTISADSDGVVAVGLGRRLTVANTRTGLQAAGILGFIDGLSEDSDE